MSAAGPRILLVVCGGLVEGVYLDRHIPGLDILVKDLDVRGQDPCELSVDSSGSPCALHGPTVHVAPETVSEGYALAEAADARRHAG